MAFDYNSRTKWEKARLERWNKEHERQINKLPPSKKELLDEILTRHPEIRLSVSIGGIHRRGFVRDLFDLADLALYRAKRQRGLYRIEE